MSKHWSVIFWLYDITDDHVLKYKPSLAHGDKLRWFHSEQAAMRYGLNNIKESQRARINLGAMPTFIAKVIESETKPDTTLDSTLRLYVRRIRLDN